MNFRETKPFRIDKNGTEYWADWTCKRCGGAGGADQWTYTGWTCYECGGSGRSAKPSIYKKYTEEYAKKLAERRKARQAKKDAELIAKSAEANKEFMEKHGFNEYGKTYVVLGDTYKIKDELKELGAKFDNGIGWRFPNKPKNYPTVELDIDDLYYKDHVQTYRWNYCTSYNEDGSHPAIDKIKEANAKLNASTSTSEYVGEIGKRYDFNVTYKKTVSFEKMKFGYYDSSYIHIHMFEDENGNVLTWKTTNYLEAKKDETIKLKGTVKEHTEYKGIKQTVLTRCKIA